MNKPEYAILPIENHELWECYKKGQKSMWYADQINFEKDVKDLNKISEDELSSISNVLTFFAVGEHAILDGISDNFFNNYLIPIESKCFYGYQSHNETIHAETYWTMIKALFGEGHELRTLIDKVENMKGVQEKRKWAKKYLKDELSSDPVVDMFYILFAQALIENVFFSVSFTYMQWYKTRNLFPGMTTANEYISRDEGGHVSHGCLLFLYFVKKYPEVRSKINNEILYTMAKEAVSTEKIFVDDVLHIDYTQMSKRKLYQYVEFIGNMTLQMVLLDPIFNTKKCPIDYMENLITQTLDNFFEVESTNYNTLGGSNIQYNNVKLEKLEDF